MATKEKCKNKHPMSRFLQTVRQGWKLLIVFIVALFMCIASFAPNVPAMAQDTNGTVQTAQTTNQPDSQDSSKTTVKNNPPDNQTPEEYQKTLEAYNADMEQKGLFTSNSNTVKRMAVRRAAQTSKPVSFADITGVKIDGDALLKKGEELKGTRYSLGAKNPRTQGAIDCSGFVTWVYRFYLGTMWYGTTQGGYGYQNEGMYRGTQSLADDCNNGSGWYSMGAKWDSVTGHYYMDEYGLGSPNLFGTRAWNVFLRTGKTSTKCNRPVYYSAATPVSQAPPEGWDFWDKGDIVMFYPDAAGNQAADGGNSHMGIYAGNGMVLNSDGNGGVRYVKISDLKGGGNSTGGRVYRMFKMVSRKEGTLHLTKHSTDTDITDNNPNYSLENARYGIWSNQECTEGTGRQFYTDENGSADMVDLDKNKAKLPEGQYYIKELEAPKGYQLDETVYPVTVVADKTTEVVVNANAPDGEKGVGDKPSERKMPKILSKEDDITNERTQNEATFKDAQFTVKYYKYEYSDEKINNGDILHMPDPGTLGQTPFKTWVFKSDEDGSIKADDAHKVSGDDLFKDEQGNTVIPYGVLTIQETKAPEGYELNSDTQVFFINDKYNVDLDKDLSGSIKDHVIDGQFKIIKTIANGDLDQSEIPKREKGAEFTAVAKKYVDQYGSVEEAIKHKDDFTNAEWDIMTTDENGEAISKKLAYGTYIVKQTKRAPETKILEEPFEFKVDHEGQDIKEYAISNKPVLYYIRIVKKDADTGKTVALNPASFKIKKADGTYVKMKIGANTYDTFTTAAGNKDGVPAGSFVAQEGEEEGSVQTPLRLKAGDYTLEEVQTPKGYLQLNEPVKFTVKEANITEVDKDGNNVMTIEAKNKKPTGELDLTKKFEEKDIANIDTSKVKFELTAKSTIVDPATGDVIYHDGDKVSVDGSTDGTYTLGTDGHLKITGLPLSEGKSSYALKEISTIDGYKLDTTEHEFTFTQTDTKKKLYTNSMELTNHITKIRIFKKDADDKPVPGAKLQVVDDKGDVVDKWTTDTNPHEIHGLSIGKTYELQEVKAPENYVKANSVKFTVKDTDEEQFVTMVDKQELFQKKDINDKPLKGAKYQIKDEQGQAVDEWTSDGTDHKASNLVAGGKYTLVEVSAPDGYVTNEPAEFTVNDDGKNQTVSAIDKQISFEKLDSKKTPVKGATIAVTDKDGNVVDTWITDGTVHHIKGLNVGQSYTLTETKTPDGYVTADPITITVDNKNESVSYKMVDTQVIVSKVAPDGSIVEGAHMQILDENKKVVFEWVTGKDNNKAEKALSNLSVKKKYTLHEEKAPAGYVRAKDIQFTTSDIEDINQKMVDTKETIKKVDQLGRLVDNAKLQVVSKDGKTIYDQWTTGQQIVSLTPEQKNELQFKGTVTFNGSLSVKSYEMKQKDNNIVENVKDMITGENKEESSNDNQNNETSKEESDKPDEKSDDTTKQEETKKEDTSANKETTDTNKEEQKNDSDDSYTITIRKIDAKTQEQLPTKEERDKAKQETKKLTQEDYKEGYILMAKDKDGNVSYYYVDENGKETLHLVSNLDAGADYVLQEIEAPENHLKSNEIAFTTMDNKDQTVQMTDTKVHEVIIHKTDIATSKELPGAKMEVIDKDGKTVDQWTSTDKPHTIKNLVVGDEYTLKEIAAPQYYDVAKSVKFKVSDNDKEVQHVYMKDSHKKKDVEISKQDASTKKELPGAHLEVTDKNGTVVDAWTSTNTPHMVKGLMVGDTYTLTERRAPNGYRTAESIQFTVADNGNVKQTCTMYDERIPNTAVDGRKMIPWMLSAAVLLGAGILAIMQYRKRLD